MLNFRKLKQDFSPAILEEGKELYKQGSVEAVKIISLTSSGVRLSCRVRGKHDNCYESEIEIDRADSTTADSDCDCPYNYDCQHLASVVFYLEDHFDAIVVKYSGETDLEESESIDDEEKAELQQTFNEAKSKENVRKGAKAREELVQEYVSAAGVLGRSPFFLPEENLDEDAAELAVIFSNHSQQVYDHDNCPEIQLALRLASRSKPLHIPDVRAFLDGVRYCEPLYVGNKRYFFGLGSFDGSSAEILRLLLNYARFPQGKGEKNLRVAQIGGEAFGTILAKAYELATASDKGSTPGKLVGQVMPCLYCGTIEQPLLYSSSYAVIRFSIEYIEAPDPKVLLNPALILEGAQQLRLDETCLFESAKPGMIHESTYYRFQPHIRRKHLRHLFVVRDITIPEPLFGTFVENAMPVLARFGEIVPNDSLDNFATLPFVGDLQAVCDLSYLDGELEANLSFLYNDIRVPATLSNLKFQHVDQFVGENGILARNLTEEHKIVENLFQDFVFDEKQGSFVVKAEKKIVEFMTEVLPRNRSKVRFNCPENLLDQFVYDDSTFTLHLCESENVDKYRAELKVDGHLQGVSLDLLWDCLSTRRPYIELQAGKPRRRGRAGGSRRTTQPNKILVLNLAKLAPVVQIFDEIGMSSLENHAEERPLWSLASIHEELFQDLPVQFTMSKKLTEIQQQMLGVSTLKAKPIPKTLKGTLRSYQVDGVAWLERLRNMHLGGILADDMGLGKTAQAITAITQHKIDSPDSLNLIVCPTSLVYNWYEEFSKFNPKLKILPIDGTPSQRKKLLAKMKNYDAVITSYSLLQKDIDVYKKTAFSYVVLDEAQHIKNRGTRNAKSVKMIQASHRLILTGTPIENSLEELWSLFDFLLPGLLSSYDRFVDKYIRQAAAGAEGVISGLRTKVAPFVLRRMKKDILTELPPVDEVIYHCRLSEAQRDLYRSYADSAREELSRLVKKEGFDKVQIHVLATLTRLKQICCHPAIFAKDKAEGGDSSKYDMLMELLQTLISGSHKVVVFSQYTRMLKIIRDDFDQMGMPYAYLDGSSKNRMSIVKRFNEDPTVPVFLVSLKAGGTGLNLTGADTVIHYDMWWNPAVESQATDRVHRIGQTRSVSAYKLVTLGTIEEKILELQQRKRNLVKQVVNCDDEAVSKLTWEEVLELLQT